MSDALLLLLVLIALLLGFLWGRTRSIRRETANDDGGASTREMTLGLNYLINDRADEAIETFIRALQGYSDSIEPALALAKLYCRRGELEKAVLLCQQQLANPSLSQAENAQVLQALGEAYFQSGLLDRAESLFLEVVKAQGAQAEGARSRLLRLYEKEKAWEKAIALIEPGGRRQPHLGALLVHYYLSLAEARLGAHDVRAARALYTRAVRFDADSVRVCLFDMQLARLHGKSRQMLKQAEQVLVLPGGAVALFALHADALSAEFPSCGHYVQWLKTQFERQPSEALFDALMSSVLEHQGVDALSEYINQVPEKLAGLDGLFLQDLFLRTCIENGKWHLLDEHKHQVFRLLLGQTQRERFSRLFSCRSCRAQDSEFVWQCRHCGAWDCFL